MKAYERNFSESFADGQGFPNQEIGDELNQEVANEETEPQEVEAHDSAPANDALLDLYRQTRCNHVTPTGRRCRNRRAPGEDFCRRHQEKALALRSKEAREIATELISDAKNFKTAIALNNTLGKTLELFAHRRISARDADTISRLAHLLVVTQERLYREYTVVGGLDAWDEMIKSNVPAESGSGPR